MKIIGLLWFDTEDFITPEADDALYGLLKVLKGRNCPATFKMVAEKARMLQRRGRTDVLDLLKEFEIGYHTEFHSAHPTIAEVCETTGFIEGRDRLFARESAGLRDVEIITGKKSTCFGQPGNSWGSQMYPALLKMGIQVYMDSHPIIDGGGRPFWYCGMLNYLDIDLNSDHRMHLRPDGMRLVREKYAWWKKQHAHEDISFLNIYYHPCEFSCTKFYDLNFARGANPGRDAWVPSPTRPPEEMAALIAQMGEFVDFLREQEVELIVPPQLLALESGKKGEVPADVVRAWAAQAATGRVDAIVKDGYSISCVEGLSLVARMLLGKPLVPSFAYGPNAPAWSRVETYDANQLAGAVLSFFDTHGFYDQMPDNFMLGDVAVDPLHAAVALSRALVLDEHPAHRLTHSFLEPARRVNPDGDWSSWPIHTEDFTAYHILELARRQMWTYKPAVF